MNSRKISDNIIWMGVVDWNKRLFDSLIPLPNGTSYNAYLIKGSQKTILIDTVEPEWSHVLLNQLSDIETIDYIISNHSEQDHSGTILDLLNKYKKAIVLCSEKAKDTLIEHINIPEDRIRIVKDGERLLLGDKTLEFIYTPWVHWPETMSTYCIEDEILFSCDFFGSHFATSKLYVDSDTQISDAAKRYYAELMMPFRIPIQKNIEKVKSKKIKLIAPSHGPIYNNPNFIISEYEKWTSDSVQNLVAIPYVSMHGSTEKMIDRLASGLSHRGVNYEIFELSVSDIGKIAMSMLDAATVVIGFPTVHAGPHPSAVYAASLINALRPKLKYASMLTSYGWGTKPFDNLASLLPNLKVEFLPNVSTKGLPSPQTYSEIDALAEAIANKHSLLNLL